jgi:ATP-dependent Clp protease ATP-binding subunit ClpC
LVERFVRDEEVARSNRVAPIDFPPTNHLAEVRLFSKFNQASRRVLRVAEQECRNHSQYYVGTEHLLVALLEERDPAIIHALDADGIDVRDVHAEVRRALGTGDERMWEGILITPRVRKIVALAEEQAGSREIEPIDLLRALRAEGGSLAAEILRRAAK